MVSRHNVDRNNNDQVDFLTRPPIITRIIDDLDIKIIKELFNDPNITSTAIASNHNIPLSTVQRRRDRLEETFIDKTYTLNMPNLGWRTGDLFISVEKGMAKKIAQELVSSKRNNVIIASLRIGDPVVDVMANIFYKDSPELHRLIESVKAMHNVTHVEWSEIVEQTESNLPNLIDRILSSRYVKQS